MKFKYPLVILLALIAGLIGGTWRHSHAADNAPATPITTGPFKNYAPNVIAALQKKGLTGDCPMCKKNQWIVHEVPVSIPVYELGGQVKFPGTSLPAAAMICKNCGFMSFHSLGALGLLNDDMKAATNPTGRE